MYVNVSKRVFGCESEPRDSLDTDCVIEWFVCVWVCFKMHNFSQLSDNNKSNFGVQDKLLC